MNARQKQWAVVGAIVLVLGAGAAVAAKIRDELRLVEVGSRAPGFVARNIATDREAPLEAYRGKVILLNIWATWCAPCRLEMPSMERVHRKFAGTDFRVVAVSVDLDAEQTVEAFVRELGLTFDVLHDPTAEIERIYQTTGVPESFVIDRSGIIVKKVIGPAEWDSPVNETLVRRLLDVR